MTSIHSLAAAVPTLALLLGCMPLERGNDASISNVIPTEANSSAGGAGGAGGSRGDARVTVVEVGQRRGGFGAEGDAGGSGPVGPSCETCGTVLGSNDPAGLCPPSQPRYDAILDCACNGACAAVCSTGAGGNCLAAWEGNAPLECKLCLLSTTGCRAAWDACLSDEGTAGGGTAGAGGGTAGAGGGGACACDPALPLCPGGGYCGTPGEFTLPGNESCGSAEYCAPCCDPGDPCATTGLCEVTKIAQVPCSADYECCSGVCTAGQCDGGCGIVLSF
jgi:hypothetical protein